ALFFPVVNLVNLNTTTQTAGELRAEIASCFDGVTALSVEVDGTPVKRLQKNPDRFRVTSVAFDVTLPAANLFEVFAIVLPSGTYSPAVGDGLYVMLKPLDVGNHLLRFRGESPCGFSVEVDGTPVKRLQKNPDRFRVTSVAFDVTLPAANLFEVFAIVLPSGTYSPAVGDGLYVMLKPLDVGNHLLRFRGESPCGFSVD